MYSKKIIIELSLFLILFFILSTNGILDLPEGSECVVIDRVYNRSGECVKYYTCLTTAIDFHYNDDPEICSFDGDLPIICCPGCDRVSDIRTSYVSPAGMLRWETGNKAQDKCQDYSLKIESFIPIHSKPRVSYGRSWDQEECDEIIYSYKTAGGGRDARPAEYPHMALLGYGNTQRIKWQCGGSLISEKFILTAAHCISTFEDGPVKFASVGLLRRSEVSDRSDSGATAQRRLIKNIIKHPEYHPPSKYHDIALLETDQPVELNRYVIPACLPAPEDSIYESILPVTAAGWGTLGYKAELADTLQVVTVEDFGEENCKRQYSSQTYKRHLPFGYNHTLQMCYGSHDQPIDTCEGDSGGPLQIQVEFTYKILGVISSGRSCGVPNQAGLYSRVSYYVPWIVETIWSNDSTSKRQNWEQQIHRLYTRNPKYKENSTEIALKSANRLVQFVHMSNKSGNVPNKSDSSKSPATLSSSQPNPIVSPVESLESSDSFYDEYSSESSDNSSDENVPEPYPVLNTKLKLIEIQNRLRDIFDVTPSGDVSEVSNKDLTSESIQQFPNDTISQDILNQLFNSPKEKQSDMPTEQYVSLTDNVTNTPLDSVTIDLTTEQYFSLSDNMTDTPTDGVSSHLTAEQYVSLSDKPAEISEKMSNESYSKHPNIFIDLGIVFFFNYFARFMHIM